MSCRLAVAAALAVAACGRIDFDPLAGALDHDEDGDGILDRDDPCPHVAGDLADRDGDGVGDACDPNPSVPTESFLLFATMQPGDQPFDDPSPFEQRADALHLTPGHTDALITRTLATARVDIGFDVYSVAATGQRQVASGIQDPAAATYYFSELNDDPPTRDAGIVQYNTTTGYMILTQNDPGALSAGSGVLRYDANIATKSELLDVIWNGNAYIENAPTPAYNGGTQIRCAFNGLDMDIRYVVVIVTN